MKRFRLQECYQGAGVEATGEVRGEVRGERVSVVRMVEGTRKSLCGPYEVGVP